ncbi:MAG TPA: YqcC family protein [Polyangiaceae bacterium]|nr:YqcC family protein [Polyangiaceae bacterium]
MKAFSQRSRRALQKLDAIEAELRRLGWWCDDPPDLLAEVRAGALRTYLDAPSFELWLQCVFLPNARAAAEADALPSSSQVGLMALRQYDYHSFVPEAQPLLGLLHDFDRIITGAR